MAETSRWSRADASLVAHDVGRRLWRNLHIDGPSLAVAEVPPATYSRARRRSAALGDDAPRFHASEQKNSMSISLLDFDHDEVYDYDTLEDDRVAAAALELDDFETPPETPSAPSSAPRPLALAVIEAAPPAAIAAEAPAAAPPAATAAAATSPRAWKSKQWKTQKGFAAFLRARDAACSFQSPNPKRARGNNPAAVARYDGFMSATTVGDFFAKGGTMGDLLYDLGMGYCTVDGAALDEAWRAYEARPAAEAPPPPRRRAAKPAAPKPKSAAPKRKTAAPRVGARPAKRANAAAPPPVVVG